MIRRVAWVLVLPAVLFSLAFGQSASKAAPVETPEAFVERLRDLLQKGRLPAYLEAFQPEARPGEKARLSILFDELKMTGVTLRTAGIRTVTDRPTKAFVQAFFENDQAAVIESWSLTLEERVGTWSVAGLDVIGTMTRLYKIRIPAGGAERAGRVEVRHADVVASFTEAAVFHDNLPDTDTALVIIGRGRIAFTPSDAAERHQLELLYKKDRIEDDIEYLFVRGSPGFFDSNVTVEADGTGAPVSAVETDRAAAVFARNYPRSFTIESSIDGQLLSFLPRGEEAILEFKARRAGELAYIYYPFSEDEVNLYDRGKDRTICLYSPNEPSQPPLKRMMLSFGEKFDIRSYTLDLSFAPASFYLSARARIEIVPKVDALDGLQFRFNPELEILKITDDEYRELFYTVDKVRKILYVYFLDPPAGRAPAAIEVVYRGRMMQAPQTTDVIAQAGSNDKIRLRPRYDTAFYSQAGFWYPQPAEVDYFHARLIVSVPPEYGCIASGQLVSAGRREDMDDVAAIDKAGNAVYTFVSRAPVKYLSFIVGKFTKARERTAPILVTSYASSEILDSRPAVADQAADILGDFSRAYGPYPYEKLDIVLRLWPTFGGHSPPSFVVLNEVPWRGDSDFPVSIDAPVDLSNYEEYFLAHEIAHQWWGQGVSFDSYKDQWLSEGLAQFAAASYLRRRYGEGAYAAILKKFAKWTEKKSHRGPIIMGSRLSYFDYAAYQAIIYNKAALALFMLQDLLGRETFEAGLRAFFEARKFGAARTAEFIAAMEAAAGRDLQDFFRGWFYAWELPEVRTAWTETVVPEGVRVDIRLTQLKGRFVFPLWVEWTRKGQTGRTLLFVDETTEAASILLPGRPDKIRINPDKAVPGKFD